MGMRIAVLASGRGSNVAVLLRNITEGHLSARICLVLSNNPTAAVLELAQKAGVPVWAQNHKDYAHREEFDQAMLQAIADVGGVDAIVLAGYMRILSPLFIQAFAGRIVNVHPALLPSFPGAHGVRDALMQGAKITGCTVHFVDEKVDHGPTIIQAAVPILRDDTEASLHARIQAMEHRIFPQAVQWLAQGRLHIDGTRVHLLPLPESMKQTQSTPHDPDVVPQCLAFPALEF